MSEPAREATTAILDAMRRGEAGAADRLLARVYDELKQMADRQMNRLPPGQTLQATMLVHDAFLKLVGSDGASFEDRRHFFGSAARAMRNILVDEARRRGRLKRGGGRQRITLDEAAIAGVEQDENLLALHEALRRLEADDPPKAEVVMLRFFAALTINDIAGVMDVSTATVDRYWAYVRAWLQREMSDSTEDADP